ncbi:hypothetical protein [Salimicrobium humidisoli]|uniref:Uncharacterized protein n=1 Tax=Salimicrobium humidisoli TaxID=2029857 RepID=A0ABX4HR99_9BACI|nr:hypothetical protein [Salimicrobium humidisoli]PBB05742.1 hypothetical protein CKW00_07005 [Salimicrobium humidisoli]
MTIKQPYENELQPGHYLFEEPGEGVIQYARAITAQYLEENPDADREELLDLMAAIIDQKPDNKRVKRCDFCRYLWHDDSKRNNKRTCSDECKRGLKTLQKRKQRKVKTVEEPPKENRGHKYYAHYEYPFWVSEQAMLSSRIDGESFMNHDAIDRISAEQEIYGGGNRKVVTHERLD